MSRLRDYVARLASNPEADLTSGEESELWTALARAEAAEAQLDILAEKLNDINLREWRDEGGRIAAAMARDALAAVEPPEEQP